MARLTADERRKIGMLSPRVIKELEVLEAERAELVEALRPFAAHHEIIELLEIGERVPQSHRVDCSRAAELLARMEGK